MKDIVLRECAAPDARALALIGRDTFAETFANGATDADMEKYLREHFSEAVMLEELETPDSAFFAAESGGEMIGYLKLNSGDAQTERRYPDGVEVQRLYVRAKYKGVHVGSALMRAALERAKNAGASGAWLGVWERNFPAIAFYERMGFVRAGEHVFMLGDDAQTDYIMYKPL